MSKEKLKIPFPDEQKMEAQIEAIIEAGIKPKQSLATYFMQLYRGIGLRYLFVNQRDGFILAFAAMVILIFFFNVVTETAQVETHIYPFLFLSAPFLYVSLLLYDYFQKRTNKTMEVEMTTKFNLYQVTAFKALIFSVLSMLVNTIAVTSLVMVYEDIHLLRAMLVSTTALFLFTVLFLAILMKKQSNWRMVFTIGGWIGVNLVLTIISKDQYSTFLLQLPIFVYGVVLSITIILYVSYLSKLVRMAPAEGV